MMRLMGPHDCRRIFRSFWYLAGLCCGINILVFFPDYWNACVVIWTLCGHIPWSHTYISRGDTSTYWGYNLDSRFFSSLRASCPFIKACGNLWVPCVPCAGHWRPGQLLQTHLSFTNAALLLLHHAGCGTPSGSIKSSKLHWGVADKIARRPIVRRRFAYKRLLRRVPRICTFGGMMKAGLNCDGMQQRLCESYGEALKWEWIKRLSWIKARVLGVYNSVIGWELFHLPSLWGNSLGQGNSL